MNLIIITGMSGAGKSVALRRMEDIGFFCVDNLPVSMLDAFAELCLGKDIQNAALVVDSRSGTMLGGLQDALRGLDAQGVSYDILYLDAQDDVLLKRYKETRRTHPLSRTGWVLDGIEAERKALHEFFRRATHVIDTSEMRAIELGQALEKVLGIGGEEFLVQVVSFGYKRGIPLDADMVFDMRFLPNPFYIPELRSQNGLGAAVREFVLSQKLAIPFLQKALDMLLFVKDDFVAQGKLRLVVAFGCTGGMHRSVAAGQWMFEQLTEAGVRCVLMHRDIEKDLQQDNN